MLKYLLNIFSIFFSYLDSSGYKESRNAFVFSFVNRDDIPPFKSDVIVSHSQNAMFTNSLFGPTFGAGHDICITDKPGYLTTSYTNFGFTYAPPNSYAYGSSGTRSLLAGSYSFRPSETEVFYVN